MIGSRRNIPQLGVVMPAFNEEENLAGLVAQVSTTLDAADIDFELVIVDDGSRDGTKTIIRTLSARDPRVCGVILTRNFGHQAGDLDRPCTRSRRRGLHHGRGLSGSSRRCRRSLSGAREADADVAYAIRRRRREGPIKRLAYHLFYRLLARLARI